MMKALGQMASGRVLSPDLFIAGGMGTVRGYPLAEITGDDGYLVSLEYVLPFPFKVSIPSTSLNLNQLLSFFGFIDHSRVFVINPQPGERDIGITGVGAGLRLNIPKIKDNYPAVSFAVTYGAPAPFSQRTSDGSNGILYFGGLISY